MSAVHGTTNDNNKENTSQQEQPQQKMPPDLLPDPKKATLSMLSSLNELHATLVCPLCDNLLEVPSTLACAHTFCLSWWVNIFFGVMIL
jgi:hypothetical protein